VPGGVAQKRETDREPDVVAMPEADADQDAADQQVAVRESHEAIGREEVPDEGREESPDVDEAAVSAEDEAASKLQHDLTIEMGGGSHTVTKKDTLWEISEATYGHGKYWKKIRSANPGKVSARRNGHRDLIHTGDELALPLVKVGPRDAFEAMVVNDPALREFADQFAMNDEQLMGMLQQARSTGMTYAQMIDAQRQFYEAQAAERGISAGEYIAEMHGSIGGGTNAGKSTKWAEEVENGREAAWQARFEAAEEKVRTQSRPDVRQAIEEATANGGVFKWNPSKLDALGVVAMGSNWNITVGMDWVEAAEDDVDRVAASVMHEMFGHGAYGAVRAMFVANESFAQLDPEEQAKANPALVSLTFGYWESEIFAELIEFGHDRVDNPTDHAFGVNPSGEDMSDGKTQTHDVRKQLQEAKAGVAPTLLPGLLQGLWRRIQNEERIQDEARAMFLRDVREVLGDVL